MGERRPHMAENDGITTTEPIEPQGETGTDWKAEARKWEKYAKENADAKKELDALRAAQMTEQERLVQRAETAERELADARAAIQHSKDVAEVAASSGVPAALLEFCADRAAMEQFAEQYGGTAPQTHSAPAAPASRVVRGEKGEPSNGEVFAALVDQLFTS